MLLGLPRPRLLRLNNALEPVPDISDFRLSHDGSGNPTDAGPNTRTINNTGAVMDFTQPEYPDGALYFNGSAICWVANVPELRTLLTVGALNTPYTFDIDFKADGVAPFPAAALCGHIGPSLNFAWSVFLDGGGTLFVIITWDTAVGAGGITRAPAFLTTPSPLRKRMRFDFDGTTTRLYEDGVFSTTIANFDNNSAGDTFAIGSRGTEYSELFFTGWIGGLRVIKGTALTASAAGYNPDAPGQTPTFAP